ncbi:hypothetical protein [Lactiplantibacillus plantarum]|uniref:hypothetical protein n=1 Tax=Lactiplantibacillus plantarum TaxID=1590 RepID=UPI000EB67F88|nr:hypothetical protein [Lactiplantibacillus plantarum]AYC72499.1 hypothetical protein D5289_10955 [Lactiplantibacillus plantarum]
MVNFNDYFHVNGKVYFNADLENDSRLFLNPDALVKVGSNLFDAKEAKINISSYFERVYLLYRSMRKAEARELLTFPREVKYTRIGYGDSSQFGRGTSLTILDEVLMRLVKSGIDLDLIKDYPQFLMLLTKNFGSDRLSDLVTNLCYEQLVNFTHKICKMLGISAKTKVKACYFDAKEYSWVKRIVMLPVDHNGMPILLMPKEAVIEEYKFSPYKFLRKVLLPSRQQQLKELGIYQTLDDIYSTDVQPYQDNKEYNLSRVIEDPSLIVEYLNITRKLA